MRLALSLGALAGAGLCQGCLFPSLDALTECEHGSGGVMDVSSSSIGPGATSGGGGDGGGDGGAGAGGGAPSPCADPLGRGADGVLVTSPAGAYPPFCIDAVEVSFRRYTDFLAVFPLLSDEELGRYLGPECAHIPLSMDERGLLRYYAMREAYTDAAFMHHALPAVGMTWCQARMHCRWAGKELCGHLDGASAEDADWRSSRWVAACSDNGQFRYSYRSDTPDAARCKVEGCSGDEGGYKALDPAAAEGRCEGGVPGLFNMSGNSYEWVDRCEANDTPEIDDDPCYPRGGACNLGTEYTYCTYPGEPQPREEGSEFVGFRCCWDAP
ncbi:SUMF1/EgtB/PvdO family nonheme iron enzyme [Sorangium sp. So ce131]|uniref:SUMF1/EgtB/PvdO family nonheme iron enzyme n=1 Tax=Sorangium sp. So ce131 TaxID=3133282 RepID=UPI003F608896